MSQTTPTRFATLRQHWVPVLFATVVIILAVGLRVWLIQSSEFPLGDGAYFFKNVIVLQDSGFIPPENLIYNGVEIQNIYPPVALYIAGLLQTVTDVDMEEIFRWYPLVVSTASIFIVYSFFRYYFERERVALLATALFALTPVSIIESIGASGVVRATGVFFATAGIYMATRLIDEGKFWQIFPVALFVALASLSQPQSGVFAFFTILIFVLNRDLEPGVVGKMSIAGVLSLLLVAIWIAFVVRAHTFAPIWDAIFSQLSINTFGKILGTLFTPYDAGLAREAILRVFGALWFIGIFVSIARGYREAVIWLAVVMFVPITTSATVIIPLAIIMAVTIDFLILTGISSFRTPRKYDPETGELIAKADNLAVYMSYVAAGLLLASAVLNIVGAKELPNFSLGTIDEENEDAMEWVSEETPPGSTFYVITGDDDWIRDEISDWFPVLAERTSYATVRGTEWVGELEYDNRITRYNALQNCTGQNAGCLNSESLRLEADVPDVYVYMTDRVNGRLRANLLANPNFELVYPFRSFDSRDGVLVFRRNS